MSMNENFLGADNAPSASPKTRRTKLHPLHEAALRLAGMTGGPPRGASRSRDLVAMLLGHGARAWRGAQPKAVIHLYSTSPSGRQPVRMRIG